jgi:hypothetical protein
MRSGTKRFVWHRSVLAFASAALLTTSLAVLAVVAISSPASAVSFGCQDPYTTRWIGSPGGTWHDPSNWDNGVPNASSDACIPQGSSVSITSGTAVVRNLSTDANSTILLQRPLSIRGGAAITDLTMQGNAAVQLVNADIAIENLHMERGTFTGTGGVLFAGLGLSTFSGPDPKTFQNTDGIVIDGHVVMDPTSGSVNTSTVNTLVRGPYGRLTLASTNPFQVDAIENQGGLIDTQGTGSRQITGDITNVIGTIRVNQDTELDPNNGALVNNDLISVSGTNAAMLIDSTNFQQRGRLEIEDGAAVSTTNNVYDQTDVNADLVLDGGTLGVATANITAGEARLNGTVTGNLTLVNTNAIIDSGTLDVGGDMLIDDATLHFRVTTPANNPSLAGAVDVAGTTQLHNTLGLEVEAAGYAPIDNDVFLIVESTNLDIFNVSNVSLQIQNLNANFTMASSVQGNEISLIAQANQLPPSPGDLSGTLYNDIDNSGTLPPTVSERAANEVVWAEDSNGDGLYDPNTDLHTTTAADGTFTFAGLSPGAWTVYAKLPAGATSPAHSTKTVVAAQTTTGADVSIRYGGGIQGTVVNDVNNDGVLDASDTPAQNVTVFLDKNTNGTLDNNERSAAVNGNYSFNSLPPGTYRVAVVPPNGATVRSASDVVVATSSVTGVHRFLSTPTTPPTTTPPTPVTPPPPTPIDPGSLGSGYLMIGANGSLFTFGEATNQGSPVELPKINAPIVDIAANPQGTGYWVAGADGGVYSYGDAKFFGSAGSLPLNKPVTGITPMGDGNGYWLVANDGGVFAYGTAGFFGSQGGKPLNQGVVAIIGTPSGKGYWLVASDGGVFCFGDAGFFGSLGSTPLNAPIVGAARTPDGLGYWLVGADGGVYAFGNAKFLGSLGGAKLTSPIVAMRAKADGTGYYLIAKDGKVSTFGTATYFGAPTTNPENVVG